MSDLMEKIEELYGLSSADDIRCRWPDCSCYSPQGPQFCARAAARGLVKASVEFKESRDV